MGDRHSQYVRGTLGQPRRQRGLVLPGQEWRLAEEVATGRLQPTKKKPRICGAFRFRAVDSSSCLAAPAKSGNVAVVAQPLIIPPRPISLPIKDLDQVGRLRIPCRLSFDPTPLAVPS